MISRQDKKTPKKGTVRHLNKIKNSISLKNNIDSNKEPMFMATVALLKRKYVERQLRAHNAEKIRRMVQSTFLLKQGRYKQSNNWVPTSMRPERVYVQSIPQPHEHN